MSSRSTLQGSQDTTDCERTLSARRKRRRTCIPLLVFRRPLYTCRLFFGHLASFNYDLSLLQTKDSLVFFRLPACAGNHASQDFFFLPGCFCYCYKIYEKGLKMYFPEQTGNKTHYRNPQNILCSTLKHKSQNPEEICINEEHLDSLRVTSNITQRTANF